MSNEKSSKGWLSGIQNAVSSLFGVESAKSAGNTSGLHAPNKNGTPGPGQLSLYMEEEVKLYDRQSAPADPAALASGSTSGLLFVDDVVASAIDDQALRSCIEQMTPRADAFGVRFIDDAVVAPIDLDSLRTITSDLSKNLEHARMRDEYGDLLHMPAYDSDYAVYPIPEVLPLTSPAPLQESLAVMQQIGRPNRQQKLDADEFSR